MVVNGQNRKVILYRCEGLRGEIVDEGQPSLRERAEVIHGAHGRCVANLLRLQKCLISDSAKTWQSE